jgi:hypothetical protein
MIIEDSPSGKTAESLNARNISFILFSRKATWNIARYLFNLK